MNPLLQAVEWLLRKIESLPLVELHTNATVSADGIALPGEEPADMLRLGAAPVGAVGVVLAVGPVRVWLGAPYTAPPASDDVGWTPLTLDPGFSGTPKWCRRDGVIYLFGRVTRDAGAWPGGLTKVATMPPAARPAQLIYTSGISRIGQPLAIGIDDRLLVTTASATAEVQLESIPPYLVTAGS